jgi:hypothetical protein
MSTLARHRSGVAAAIVAGGLALALLLGPANASATASRAEYAQQADPICKSTNQDWTRLWKRFIRANKKLRFHAAGNALASIGTLLSSTTASLRQIAPPPGDEALIAKWLGIWDRIAHFYGLAASDYRLGKYSSLRQVLKGTVRLNRQAGALVADFPFQACA